MWAHTDKMPLIIDVVAVRLGDQSAMRWPSGKTGWEAAKSYRVIADDASNSSRCKVRKVKRTMGNLWAQFFSVELRL